LDKIGQQLQLTFRDAGITRAKMKKHPNSSTTLPACTALRLGVVGHQDYDNPASVPPKTKAQSQMEPFDGRTGAK